MDKMQMDLNKKAAYTIAFVIGVAALSLTSLKSYVFFHSIAELFSIVIAAGIFIIAWNTRKFVPNAYLLFILIFDPYFTTKGVGEGTGMGLALVHGIVKSYGGKITVGSKPGQKTLFTIYLPVTRKRQEHYLYQSETLPTGKERILFVDDEAPIAKIGGQTLEKLGYTVSIRTNSLEALELFRTKPNDFDLIITDMTMPNMTGDSLAIELMKIRSDIPVILCTGYSKKISNGSA